MTTSMPMAEPPLILATKIDDLDRLGGLMVHETTSVTHHLTFTDLAPMGEVMIQISGDRSLTDDERTFLAVPGAWSLYVSTAALASLAAAEQPPAYRIEGK